MKKIILFCSFLSLCSCAAELYVPLQATETASVEVLTKGRASYVENCSGCHSLKSPYKYNKIKWHEIMVDMQKEAKISTEERELIYKYLINAPIIVKK